MVLPMTTPQCTPCLLCEARGGSAARVPPAPWDLEQGPSGVGSGPASPAGATPLLLIGCIGLLGMTKSEQTLLLLLKYLPCMVRRTSSGVPQPG